MREVMIRLWILLISTAYVSGCSQQSATPTIPPAVKISATVYDVPDLNITALQHVVVPQDRMAEFTPLITPTTSCTQQIDAQTNYHVADVYLQHEDDSVTRLIVRWTGHNPAAISLDGRRYYYGGSDPFPDEPPESFDFSMNMINARAVRQVRIGPDIQSKDRCPQQNEAAVALPGVRRCKHADLRKSLGKP